jgi:thiamine-monophosphate kinase
MNEFYIIKKYLSPLSKNNLESLNLSDDIYFDKRKRIAISIDTYNEGVHFINSSDPSKFLKKILRSSLSDLYCKGIKPKTYFLSWSLNKKLIKANWFKKVNKILKSEQKKFNIYLGGGDTTYSSKFSITIVVLGITSKKPIFRKGSSIKDDIYVTGFIGDSYLGLSILKRKNNFGFLNSYFKKKYYEPDVQYKFSSYIPKLASASIDISDGLAQDLKHICEQSKLGAFVDLNLLPLSPPCESLIKEKKIKLKNIFSNGDDYQILFTSNPKNKAKINDIKKKLKIKITRIGYIKKEKNMVFNYKGAKLKLKTKKMGYIHNF